ncbi:MAG: prepilin-type N-terminal cleavage/methylation domain-containing protein [Phycisphaerales bacterium]|nr:prepilin-type N-terminal cleavage/methylation domain-containing protein [Phycisphaerales bacterium]
MRTAHRLRAFTLIETLTVLIILSLTAAICSMYLTAGSEQARVRAAAASWQDLDAMARLHARAGHAIQISLDREGHAVTLRSNESNVPLRELALPAGWRGALYVNKEPTDAIVVDRRGRSLDYRAELRPDDASTDPIVWTACGLTGWVIDDGVSP